MRAQHAPTIGALRGRCEQSSSHRRFFPATNRGALLSDETRTCDRTDRGFPPEVGRHVANAQSGCSGLGDQRRSGLAASVQNGHRGAVGARHCDAAGSASAAHSDDHGVRADAAVQRHGARQEFLSDSRDRGGHGRCAGARRAVRPAARVVHARHDRLGERLHCGSGPVSAFQMVRLCACGLHRCADRHPECDGASRPVSGGAHARGGSGGRHRVLERGERADRAAAVQPCTAACATDSVRKFYCVRCRCVGSRHQAGPIRAALCGSRRRDRRFRGDAHFRRLRRSGHAFTQSASRPFERRVHGCLRATACTTSTAQASAREWLGAGRRGDQTVFSRAGRAHVATARSHRGPIAYGRPFATLSGELATACA